MKSFRRQIALGLFISCFFFRMGFCLLLFVVGALLSPLNIWFLRVGVAALVLDLIVSVWDTLRCLHAMKKETGNPDLDHLFRTINDVSETPYTDIDEAVEQLTGIPQNRMNRKDNPYLPLAEKMKEKIEPGMTLEEATEVFREIAETSEFEDEDITFNSFIGKRYADGKKYLLINFNLRTERASLSFNVFFLRTWHDPDTILEIICDAGREAFYQEVYDHKRYQDYAQKVPAHIDVVCGE